MEKHIHNKMNKTKKRTNEYENKQLKRIKSLKITLLKQKTEKKTLVRNTIAPEINIYHCYSLAFHSISHNAYILYIFRRFNQID